MSAVDLAEGLLVMSDLAEEQGKKAEAKILRAMASNLEADKVNELSMSGYAIVNGEGLLATGGYNSYYGNPFDKVGKLWRRTGDVRNHLAQHFAPRRRGNEDKPYTYDAEDVRVVRIALIPIEDLGPPREYRKTKAQRKKEAAAAKRMKRASKQSAAELLARLAAEENTT